MTAPTTAPEFVSFHSDRPAGAASAHPNATLASRSYMRMLAQLFRSARLFHSGAVCTLLTDRGTRVRGIRGPVRRLDTTIDHKALMWARSCGERARRQLGILVRQEASTVAGAPAVAIEDDADV